MVGFDDGDIFYGFLLNPQPIFVVGLLFFVHEDYVVVVDYCGCLGDSFLWFEEREREVWLTGCLTGGQFRNFAESKTIRIRCGFIDNLW